MVASKTIALDIDGVLANFNKRLLECVKKLYNIKVQEFELVSYDYRNLFGLTDKEEEELFDLVFDPSGAFDIIDGSLEGCRALQKDGFNLFCLTARYNETVTHEWLDNHGFSDLNIPVYFTKHSENIPNFDYMLDDSPRKIANHIHKITDQAFCMTGTLNRYSHDVKKRYEKVYDWRDFLNQIFKRHPTARNVGGLIGYRLQYLQNNKGITVC